MGDDRGARLDRIVQAAGVRPPDAREAFVNDACREDAELRDDVLSRLGHEASVDDPREPPGPRAPLEPGQRLGPYTLSDLIGAGGMGEVYRAKDTRLGRTVALKILPSDLRSNPRLHARFEQEARAIAGLNHPNVCTLHDVGCHDGIDFLVMEYIAGETLGSRLRRGPLAVDAAVRCARDVADALAAAHASGLIHRDIKPSNIIIGAGGHVKVVDFGLATLAPLAAADETTRTNPSEHGVVVGTPRYMSPEQARGQPLDQRTDIFSLGVVMFESLTGRLPFDGTTREEYLRHLLAGNLRSVRDFTGAVPKNLQVLVARCLESEASRRLDSAARLSNELGRLCSGEAMPLPGPIGFWARLGRAARVAIGLAVAMLAIVAVWFVAGQWRGASDRRQMYQNIITTADGVESASRLSPDGQWISFIQSGRNDRLMAKQVGAGEPFAVKLPAGILEDHLWSPNRKEFACLVRQDDGRTLQFVDAPFGGAVPLRTVDIPANLRAVTLLRWIDQTIFFQSTDSGSSGLKAPLQLHRIILANAKPYPELLNGPWSKMQPTGFDVQPQDGRQVIWAASAGIGRGDLWTAGLEGGQPRRLTSETDESLKQFPLYTGLGRTVVYQSNRLGPMDLWEIDRSGGEPSYLPSSSGDEKPESSSSDGSISFQATSEKAELLAWDTKSHAEFQVSREALSDLAPSVSRNGRVLAFQRSQPAPIEGFLTMDTDIFIAFIDDVRRSVRAGVDPQRKVAGLAPRLSPDGKWLAYLRRVAGLDGQTTTQATLSLFRVETGRTESLSSACRIPANTPFPVGWTGHDVAWGSSEELYFVEHFNQTRRDLLKRYRIGQSTETLLETKTGQRLSDVYPSADGRMVAYVTRDDLTSAINTFRLWTYDVAQKLHQQIKEFERESSVYLRGWTRGDAALVLIRSEPKDRLRTVEISIVARDRSGVRAFGPFEGSVTPGLAYLSNGREDEVYLTLSEGGVANLKAVSLSTGQIRQVSRNSLLDVSFGAIEALGPDAIVAVRHKRNRDIHVFAPVRPAETKRGR